jgi:hypothetical protein
MRTELGIFSLKPNKTEGNRIERELPKRKDSNHIPNKLLAYNVLDVRGVG